MWTYFKFMLAILHRRSVSFVFSVLVISCFDLGAQDQKVLSVTDSITIDECLKYAFLHQPLVKQLKLDEEIASLQTRISLADWIPQVAASAGLQHYLKQPVLLFPDFNNPSGPKILIPSGVLYNSSLGFTATQNIFNPDVYVAGRSARLYRMHSKQASKEALTGLVVEISKAFYNVLLSQEQLSIINREITRLTKSLEDSYALYQSGKTDMIDYKRATMALNEAKAGKKSAEEAIHTKLDVLKHLIGYPVEEALLLKTDAASLEKDLMVDTLKNVNIYNRIEYQLLRTDLQLQKARIAYYKAGILPSLSAFANYNFIFQNDRASDLYNRSYPNSIVGLTLTVPIFQGFKRTENIRKSRLEYDRLALDTVTLRSEIRTEYMSALSSYKSNLALFNATRQNTDLAREIYNMVRLQYTQGIKSYLEVLVSETDLMSANISNLNALFMLMFSKLDLQKASGELFVDY
jgi:outer membrane protein